MTTETDRVVRYFRRRCGEGRILHNAACHLLQLILGQPGTGRVKDLMAFCANPENLKPWLPNATDRLIFSEGLLEGLRDLTSQQHHGSRYGIRTAPASMN
ncbi:MAG TPA: hypothetical protein PKY77_05240 [Phycisphaerae bacterium]|nr:hypothetical protein [Phycisphaerae bacterium]HRY68919.1 hypothetical protein [Phycisphaerae bacterium]HSA25746.1 hypothetical protein [Phycisphaerae bacterium]